MFESNCLSTTDIVDRNIENDELQLKTIHIRNSLISLISTGKNEFLNGCNTKDIKMGIEFLGFSSIELNGNIVYILSYTNTETNKENLFLVPEFLFGKSENEISDFLHNINFGYNNFENVKLNGKKFLFLFTYDNGITIFDGQKIVFKKKFLESFGFNLKIIKSGIEEYLLLNINNGLVQILFLFDQEFNQMDISEYKIFNNYRSFDCSVEIIDGENNISIDSNFIRNNETIFLKFNYNGKTYSYKIKSFFSKCDKIIITFENGQPKIIFTVEYKNDFNEVFLCNENLGYSQKLSNLYFNNGKFSKYNFRIEETEGEYLLIIFSLKSNENLKIKLSFSKLGFIDKLIIYTKEILFKGLYSFGKNLGKY